MNKNQTRRDELLKPFFEQEDKEMARYGFTPGYSGGIRRYSGLTVEVLEQLIAEGFVDVNERQNESPSIAEFLEFAKLTPQSVFLIGYAVAKDRSDYRLSVEGVICPTGHAHKTAEFKARWKKFGHNADEKSVKRLWWD
jgi:hypothetical protein